MKKTPLLLLGLLLGFTCVKAQETGDIPIDEAHFSDAAFREYIANTIDMNQDGFLSAAEREDVIILTLNTDYPIIDYDFINGLHYFPNLKSISVSNIDSIDLKGCTSLTYLSVRNNDDYYHELSYNQPLRILSLNECSSLDTLFIWGNLPKTDWQLSTSLTHLTIGSDSLRSFDFALPNLKSLYLNATITEFNISSSPDIQTLSFIGTHLTELNLNNLQSLVNVTIKEFNYPHRGGTIPFLKHIKIHNCPNLSKIEGPGYTYSCIFPILESIDFSGCTSLTEFSRYFFAMRTPSLTDINLADCNKLSVLYLQSDKLSELNLTDCANLTDLYIEAPLTELHWPEPFNLETIKLASTKLKSLNISNQTSLATFTISNDSTIQSIDLSGCTNLANDLYESFGRISISFCQILEHLNLSGCVKMQKINCSSNGLKHLNLTGLADVKILDCSYNQLENLDLTTLTALRELDCSDNRLEQLRLSGLYDLERLNLENNRLTALDLESFWKLIEVLADNNQLAFLNVPTNTRIRAYDNFHPVRLNAQHAFNLNLLPGFDISKMRRLEGGVLNGKMLTFLQDTVYYEYRCSETTDGGVFFALVRDPSSAPGDLPISAENFPDARFRAYIQTHLDTDGNDSLSDEECLAATEIDVADQQIRTLRGLHHFVYLKYLNADGNLLTSLDLSRNAALEVLSCDDNYLEVETDAAFSFDLASLPDFDLSRLRFVRGGTLNGSRLTFLRDTVRFEYQTYYAGAALVPQSVPFHLVTDLPDVPEFGGLPISEENFPDETFRQYVAAQFDRNANDSLSERERAAVSEINVAGLGIGSLQGLEHFPYLEKLDCSRNHLTALDLSGNNALQTLYCYENSLFVELDDRDGFDLLSLPDFEPERAENWKGGVVSGDTLRFIAKEVSYAYRHRLAGGTGVPETVSFTLTSDKRPDEPTANEDAEATAAEALFRVHPMPFRHTLHIETALDLKRVSLYNMQGRLCSRYLSGFDALPADDLEPGLYLLLLETADGSTYRIKAVKE